jgi:ATP-dependent helicase/nuclease subunit B
MVFRRAGKTSPQTLTEEGRLMVLRGLLAAERCNLNLFRASARLTGFAQQLSEVLGEVQRAGLSPAALRQAAAELPTQEGLAYKLQDLASLLEQYLDWLKSHDLSDADALLRAAAGLARAVSPLDGRIGALWVDGFAEFNELELDLLSAVIPCCDRATLTFCLDAAPSRTSSWLSHWSPVGASFDNCRKRLASLAGVEMITETLQRQGGDHRFFKNPVLQHLETFWAAPRPYPDVAVAAGQLSSRDPSAVVCSLHQPTNVATRQTPPAAEIGDALRLVACVDREAEVTLAAREIVRFVRAGARYKDVSVLLRKLDPYYQTIQRVFSRYQIPFFLDRRESIAHHPLAELTRSALRVIAFGWQPEDWFAALKCGLVSAQDDEIDLLENESLARGWKGQAWLEPIHLRDVPKTVTERERLDQLETQLEQIRRRILPPFERFILDLGTSRNRPTGPQLASALRGLWSALNVGRQLEDWAAAEPADFASRAGVSAHETVWRQMNAWLDNAELAFPTDPRGRPG